MAIVSRLELDHPALGAAGGVALHAQVEALYKKLGDSLQSRWYQLTDFDNGESVDLDHNFDMDIGLLRWDLYVYTGGAWVKVTSTSSPALSAFTVVEKVGDEDNQLTITNVSGGNDLLAAVVITNDPLYLSEGDIEDIDVQTVPPEDGQALVYEAATKKFKPGASGDASLKVQSVAANGAIVVKGGYLIDDSGAEYATYDGSGSASTDFGVDISFDLDTLVPSPANNTTYNLYLDKALLSDPVTLSDNSRKLIAVTGSHFIASTSTPGSMVLERYIPIGFVRHTTGGTWSTTIFGTFAFRRHQDQMVAAQPLVYEDTDHSIGSVGSAGQLATYGSLETTSFPTPSLAHVYGLDTNSNDVNGTPLNLTQNGSPSFTGVGFFGKENLARFAGAQSLSSANAGFTVANAAFSYGGWFKVDDWGGVTQAFIGNHEGSSGWYLRVGGTIDLFSNALALSVAHNFEKGSWHHIAATYTPTGTLHTLYIDGQKAGTLSSSNTSPGTPIFRIGAKGSTASQFLSGLAQDCFFTTETLTDAQINGLYSKRFKGQQLAGGHVLDADSFPLTSLVGKATFYNLSANANDGSANAKNLTNNGSIPFTGLGLFGAANAAQLNGSSQHFSASDSFFAESTTKVPLGFFGWFAADDWTPGSTNRIFTFSSGQTLYLDGTSLILDGAATLSTSMASLGLVDGQWAHIGVTYLRGVNTVWVNGVAVASNSADYGTLGTDIFIGRTTSASQYFKGRMSNLCFLKNFDITAQDILKLMSTRVDLPSSVLVGLQDQNWKMNVISEDGKTIAELSDAALLDKKDTKAYLYFGGASGSRANIRLYDGGLGATAVPVRKFDRKYTSTPPTTIAHNLPSMPTHVQILHNENADGRYRNIAQDASVKADGTNIYVDLSSYTIDATRDVRIVASVGTPFVATDTNVQEGLEANASLNMVNVSYLDAVNGAPSSGQFRSDITGRAKVIADDLKPSIGIERILMQDIKTVTGERGPAGQKVSKPSNDRFNRIRVVGDNFFSEYNILGWSISSGNNSITSGYIEVVFLGTGLDMLSTYIDGSNRSVAVSVDGGSETTVNRTGSAVLTSRNYCPYIKTPLLSGLSYGWHTAKIRPDTTADTSIVGFDVLNNATTIKTAPGSALINGLKRTLASTDSQAYDSGFDSGTLGTRGGRVVMYMRKDGTIGKSVQPVAATTLTDTSTDHVAANEEVIRAYHWREFGANRNDDFSTLAPASPSSRSFTLDDNITTLAGSSVYCISASTLDSVAPQSNGAFLTLTFMGTGLDIKYAHIGTGGSDTFTASVNGGTPFTLSSTGTQTGVERIQKIVSGLPYGTHTVKITRTSAPSAYDYAINQFIVYGPKKPTLPVGALELADYNVVATYAANATAGLETIATGVIRKNVAREITCVGSTIIAIDVPTYVGYGELAAGATGSYFEFSFFGVGVELRGRANTVFHPTVNVTLNGLAATVANFPSLVTSAYGGFSFSGAGVWSQNVSNTLGSGVSIRGLPLGYYTIRMAAGSNVPNGMILEAIDVISPIHINKANGPLVLQGVLNVGDIGPNDLRKFGSQLAPLPMVSRSHPNSGTNTASTTEVPMALNAPFYLSEDSHVSISMQMAASNSSSGQNNNWRMRVDGDAIETFNTQLSPGSTNNPVHFEKTVFLPKGWHHVHMGWSTASGTLSMPNLASGGSEYGTLTVRKTTNG